MRKKSGHMKVDDVISAVEGGWEFTDEVADHFDSHVRKSIPLYEEIQDMTVNLSEWFIHNGSTVYDIGASTGETIHRLQRKHASKENVIFTGIDNSEKMVKHARKKVSARNVRFLCQDVLQTEFEEADLIISLFTLQFLGIAERTKVLHRLFQSLRSGGALILGEKVLAEEGRFDEIWVELYWDFKRSQGLTDDQILHKARSIRGVLRPITLTEHIKLLRETGFNNIDVFLKWCNFAGIVAMKTSAQSVQSTGFEAIANVRGVSKPESISASGDQHTDD